MIDGWHKTWEKAIRANSWLALGLPGGEDSFTKLLKVHGKDGIVYYERGQAYEFLGKRSLAEPDYDQAREHFPLAHWKDVAREALDRIGCKEAIVPSKTKGISFETISHRIHAVPEIPHLARVCALFSAARIDSQPWMSAMLFRMAPEVLVVALLKQRDVDYSKDDGLCRWIALLSDFPEATPQVIKDATDVRRRGNKAVHLEQIDASTAEAGLMRFVEIVEWVGENRLLSKSRVRQ